VNAKKQNLRSEQLTSLHDKCTVLVWELRISLSLHVRRSLQRLLYDTTRYKWLYVIHVSQTGYTTQSHATSAACFIIHSG